ncbi:hypothetical protein C5Y96_26880 [Blastopirellula marina]|uniref:Uncharacterized protein n=1 Tax=Blastopirellula marina TaxID=124 RepID=A0A2S8EYX2_9BACT|nr:MULTISPECIES: hypothetical protein [Pirellulaceae]PQO25126.1 hypothetical protein C5Y96_26880 [Blastopirellula marina]RCS40977.1 hypothetical protein DTL36_26925 [Bremerella cremea]
MYAACLLITSAVLGVDFGYQPTDSGQLEYIIQIEPEAIEKLKSGEAIQVGLPPNVQRVQVFRVQVGDAELPKILPTSYEEPVNERTNEIGLMPTESPKLTAPPETTSAADTRPALGEELAQYIPRQTRTLPSGATEPVQPSTSTATNTGSSFPAIPGAAERYGGASSTAGSRFSVPATPGSPYGAVQTSGTTPLGSVPTPPSTNTGSTTGSQYNAGSTSTPGSTATPGSTMASGGATGGSGTTWNATTQNSGTTNSGTSATNPYRFNQPAAGSNQSAPDLISPSDSNNWVSNTGQSGTGSTYGNNQTNTGTNQTGQTGGTLGQPNNTGSNYTYPGSNTSQQNSGNLANNSGTNTDSTWPASTWNQNQTGVNTAPYSPLPNNNQNTQQQPQYNNQQPPPGYNPQQPYGSNFVNNGYGQQPPYNYGANPNYQYNNQQPPYYQPPYAGQQPVAQVAYNQPAGTAPPTQQSPSGTTNASVSGTEKETEIVEKVVEKEVETLPSWWPFLAFGFLLSFCANGYMFIISQDFQRKYQDLLEDVRDLRTMSND